MGITIFMFYDDHAPPHFHARYGEKHAMVGINPLNRLQGDLPPGVMSLVIEWARMHNEELLGDWLLAREMQPLKPIAPLE